MSWQFIVSSFCFTFTELVCCNCHSLIEIVMYIYTAFLLTPLLAITCCCSEVFCAEPAAFRATIKEQPDSKELVIEVSGFNPESVNELSTFAKDNLLHQVMKVYVADDLEVDAQLPAVLGNVTFDTDHVLIFRGKYPLSQDVPYTVQVTTSGKRSTFQVISKSVPKDPTTIVKHIYPSTEEIPENVLKFYIEFSAPMSFGQVYQHIELVAEDGVPLPHPFLEVAEELWDPSGTRLTLLLDPARIKRGLVPHEEDGAILYANRKYTLVVKSTMKDTHGVQLKQEHRKTFRTLHSDHNQPSPVDWRIGCVKAGTLDEIVIFLVEPLDHAILQRGIQVLNSRNQLIDGKVSISDNETVWRFSPKQRWQKTEYSLRINERIEDLAGNSIAKPFEVFDDASNKTSIIPVTSLKFMVADDCDNQN